jgi:putative membrane protein
MRFILKVVLSAVALWLTTLIVAGHITVRSFGEGETWQVVLTYLLVAFVFGIVNAVVGTVIRIVAFPLYILTLGLISFIVNGLLLWLVHWLSSLFGFGLEIIGGFWWGVLGALVLGILNGIFGLIFRPVLKKEGRNH